MDRLGTSKRDLPPPPTPEEAQKLLQAKRDGVEIQLAREGQTADLRKRKKNQLRDDAFDPLFPVAIDALHEIMNDETATAAQRLQAAKLIVEHSIGKPTQQIEMEEQVHAIEYRIAYLPPSEN